MIIRLCNPFGKDDGDNRVCGKVDEVVDEINKDAVGKTSRNKAWNVQNRGLASLIEMTLRIIQSLNK